ncbi:MAG: response regulator [Caulobacterales bacterium]|nr:response regulator [Caulobacterales bacterium]
MSDLDRSLAYRLSLDMAERLDGALAFAGRLERMRLGADGDACVEALRETLNEAREIVGRAIDLRRAQARTLTLNIVPVRLRDLIDAVSDRWRDRAAAAGVTLLLAYDGQPELAVRIDGDRLAQCIDGLIGHALSRGGPAAVEAGLTARGDGDMVTLEVSVRDGASGRPEAPHVAGALGLALARELVGTLGGQMQGGGNAGAGSTWSFKLSAPIAEAAAPERQATAAAFAHVLIVDDNATNRMVAEALCEGFDCTSETACDGLEAVEAMRQRRFDVVLMDIKMPNMDGLSATAAIRALPGPIARTPILAMTANANPSDVALYQAAGMQGVVEKPIKPEQLAAALESALLGPRADADEMLLGQPLEAAGASPYNPPSSRLGA